MANNKENKMSNTNTDLRIVTVPAILELCEAMGAKVTELKSYFKVTAPEYNHKSLYVGKAKRRLTRLDISGFEPQAHPAIAPLCEQDAKDLKLGAVRGQILPKTLRNETDNVHEAVSFLIAEVLAEGKGFKLGTRVASSPEAEEIAAVAEEALDILDKIDLTDGERQAIKDEVRAAAVA